MHYTIYRRGKNGPVSGILQRETEDNLNYRVGFLQLKPEHLEPETNLRTIEKRLLEAPEADLMVLPELAVTGYLLKDRVEVARLAESAQNGPSVTLLKKLSKQRNTSYVMGFVEQSGDRVYNASMLVNPDGNVHIYRKVHLFDDEKRVFDSGDLGFPVFEAKDGIKVGLMICFDWIFPESARSLALGGAQILCHSVNLVLPWCQRAMLTRTLENGVFAVTANRYGKEEYNGASLHFTGQSQIVTNRGELVYRAQEQSDETVVREIDPEKAFDKMITGRNHLFEDRFPELYRTDSLI